MSFDANTGAVTLMWTDPLRMDGVALTDDGSMALVTQDNQATLVDTSTGNILFSVAGSGAGSIFYPISGDGSVFVVGGFNFDVYAFNGTTYTQVIHFTQANFWFGGASTVSHDGSTVGTFRPAQHQHRRLLQQLRQQQLLLRPRHLHPQQCLHRDLRQLRDCALLRRPGRSFRV
jgi:hypothetical protein